MLVEYLNKRGIRAGRVRLRFPRLFSVPFLVYARLRGFSRRMRVDGVEHGIWNFEGSWLMKVVFPWAILVDLWLLSIIKVYIPILSGSTLVCDRYVLDVLVDLMTGLKDTGFDQNIPGRLFFSILPDRSKIIVLDLDSSIAKERSPELRGDQSQDLRREIYLKISQRRSYPVISTDAPIQTIQNDVRRELSLF